MNLYVHVCRIYVKFTICGYQQESIYGAIDINTTQLGLDEPIVVDICIPIMDGVW